MRLTRGSTRHGQRTFLSECLCDEWQEEEARQIALLEEAMRRSPSLVSALSEQLLADNVSMRSFRGGHEPYSFSLMDHRGHLVGLAFTCSLSCCSYVDYCISKSFKKVHRKQALACSAYNHTRTYIHTYMGDGQALANHSQPFLDQGSPNLLCM